MIAKDTTYQDFLDLINNHLKDNPTTEESKRREWLRFDYNGENYEVSVQASEYHYSLPRDNNSDYYEEVELGFPNFLFSKSFIAKYAEDKSEPKGTVYPYVPVEELAQELSTLFSKGVVK